jgi:hypothetical protein
MRTQAIGDIPITCDLSALEPDVRANHMETALQLLRDDAAETIEIEDGYRFRYHADQFAQVVQFIENERRCCPFFTFHLEVSAGFGPLWLQMTGGMCILDRLRSDS